jgi:hypothetical protein
VIGEAAADVVPAGCAATGDATVGASQALVTAGVQDALLGRQRVHRHLVEVSKQTERFL